MFKPRYKISDNFLAAVLACAFDILRTPLTKVSTNIQTAKRRPEEAEELLTKSQSEIMRMAGMISDALKDDDRVPAKPQGFVGKRRSDGASELSPQDVSEQSEVHADEGACE